MTLKGMKKQNDILTVDIAIVDGVKRTMRSLGREKTIELIGQCIEKYLDQEARKSVLSRTGI